MKKHSTDISYLGEENKILEVFKKGFRKTEQKNNWIFRPFVLLNKTSIFDGKLTFKFYRTQI